MAGSGRRKTPRWFLLGLSAVAVAGCDVGPAYNTPVFPFASSFGAKKSAAPVLLDNAAWWEKFDDSVLNDLVGIALTDNLDLALARERVTEATALAGTVPELVTVTGSVDAGRKGGRNIADENGGEGTFGFDWLLDPWGERRAQVRAARGRVDVAEAELNAARLLLLSNLTTAYVDLRFYQRSLMLRRQELRSRQQTVELLRKLTDSSAATRLDVVRAEALVSETQSLIPGTEAAGIVQRNRIAVLLGRQPGQVDALLQGNGKGQPVTTMPANIGIPADLLRNRPDIQVAERLYYVAVEEIGVEKAKLYPTLSIGGELSLSSFGGVTGMEYFLGPTLRLPALPDSPQRSQVAVRESRARQALTSWQVTVLGAIEDVESALVQYSSSQASVSSARRTVQLYQEIVNLNQKLLGGEGATVRDLLDAEQSVAVANILLTQNLRKLGQDFVVLNVSLGSGNNYQAGATAERKEASMSTN